MKIHTDRFDFTFPHMARSVIMHCQPDQHSAKEAFQARYGYWPEDAWYCKRYVSNM